jgi:SNF2 family DNA or RNA helicase
MGDTGKNLMLGKLLQKTKDKIIIFVKFKETLYAVSEFLEWNNFPHALFHGGLNNQEKDEQIRLFKDERNIFLTTEVGGEGRNLQFCHQMINYDLPWNPMKIEQRIGRIHRIGQKHEVMIYNFCGVGSIEEYILDILDRKINMFELVIGEIDMILGRIKGEQDFSEMVYEIWMNTETKEEKEEQFGGLATKLKRSKASYQKTKVLDEKLFGENYEL